MSPTLGMAASTADYAPEWTQQNAPEDKGTAMVRAAIRGAGGMVQVLFVGMAGTEAGVGSGNGRAACLQETVHSRAGWGTACVVDRHSAEGTDVAIGELLGDKVADTADTVADAAGQASL